MTVTSQALCPRPGRSTGPDSVRVRLPGGSAVELRPLRRGEEGALLSVFEGMSPESRSRRYLTGLARLPASMLRALTDIDDARHVGWVASMHGRPVGIARTVLEEPGAAEIAAEIAVEVVDDHQGLGIASVLVDAVTTVAAANGVRRVRATLRPDNEPSRRLVSRIGVRLRVVDGLLEGEGPLRLLDSPRVDRRDVVALALRTATRTPDAGCAPAAALA